MRFYRCPQGQNDEDSVTQTIRDCLGKNSFMIDHVFESGVGGGYSTNVYTGRLRPEVQPLIFFILTIFHKKDIPFVYPLLTNGTPFAYLV